MSQKVQSARLDYTVSVVVEVGDIDVRTRSEDRTCDVPDILDDTYSNEYTCSRPTIRDLSGVSSHQILMTRTRKVRVAHSYLRVTPIC